jgi:hypothetical protein
MPAAEGYLFSPMRFCFRLLWLGWLLPGVASAQYFLGVSGSNYAGTNGLYLNPATVADSRHKIYVNLVSNDLFLTNNYLAWEAPYSVLGLMTNTVAPRHRSSRGLIFWNDAYLAERLNGRRKHLRLGNDLRGPSVLLTLNDRHGVALTSRVRANLNFTDVHEPVARLIRYGTTNQNIQPESFGEQFNLNATATLEIGATYGFVLQNDEDRFIKVGLTAKRLVGLYAAHLLASDVDYHFETDPRMPRRTNIRLDNLTAKYGYTEESAFQNIRPTPAWLLGDAPAGSGWGMDVGLVYEYRPDHRKYSYRERNERRYDPTKNKYLYRLSLSLLDVGGIRFRNPAYVNHYQIQRQGVLFTENNFVDIAGADDVFDGVNQTLELTDGERQTKFWKTLPTAFHAGLDYKIKERVYVNTVWVQSLTSNRRLTMQVPSVLAVVPRYETKWFEASLPVALADHYSRLTIGAALRLGPVFVGTDHLGGVLNLGNPRGLDFYFGANVPILRSAPKSALECFPKKERRGIFRRKR